VFSRNPLTGDREPSENILACAQGAAWSQANSRECLSTMKLRVPNAYQELMAACVTLERENGDVQDIEFTWKTVELYYFRVDRPEGAGRGRAPLPLKWFVKE